MSTIRVVIFLLGLALMAISLLVPFVAVPSSDRFNRAWLFDLGLLLALGAAHWPENLR